MDEKMGVETDSQTRGDSVWNFASAHSLVIVTANVPPSGNQRVDIEIIDGSERANVYLSKKVGSVIQTSMSVYAFLALFLSLSLSLLRPLQSHTNNIFQRKSLLPQPIRKCSLLLPLSAFRLDLMGCYHFPRIAMTKVAADPRETR